MIDRVIRYQDAGKVQLIRRGGKLLSEVYESDGIHVIAYVPPEVYGKL